MNGKVLLWAAAILAAGPAFAQSSQPYPEQYPPPPPPPQAQPAQPAQPSSPQSQSTAGSQGQSSTAQPSSPGASSQQVVVNPPPSQQPSTNPPAPPPAPPSTTTVVNPPPTYGDNVVVTREPAASPFETIVTDAAYGGVAGLLVGFGVTLVNQFDHWGRDLMVGAGIGVLVGAGVGAVHAGINARDERERRRVAYTDGLNRTDKDPVRTAPALVGYAFRF